MAVQLQGNLSSKYIPVYVEHDESHEHIQFQSRIFIRGKEKFSPLLLSLFPTIPLLSPPFCFSLLLGFSLVSDGLENYLI